MTRTIAALCCLLMTLIGAPAVAAASGAPPHLPMTLVAETMRPRAGSSVAIALEARPETGWHGYWGENPGDAGFPPRTEWTLPAGARAGAWRWPVPSTLLIAGLMNYVYERPFAALTTIDVPAGLAVGTALPVRVKLGYLVCTEMLCVPEAQEVALTLTVGDGSGHDTRFDAWRRALPKPLGSAAAYRAADGRVRIAVPYPRDAGLDEGYLFPVTAGAIGYAAPQKMTRDGDRLVVETAGNPTGTIDGVLRVGPGQGLRVRAVPGAVPAAQAWWQVALLAFAGAVAGGLLLNVMPCVFPILSLKALSLARTGRDGARREAIAYTAGVVLVCVGLGATILLLRAGGATVGWAFQLQDPRMIVALLALSIAIASNLSGLWAMPGPSFSHGGGAPGAFATGALAAFVATPCTGPFMAAALGAALVLPWPAALAVFAGLGLGLALPFLAIGFVPALRRRLPRPGPWMERLRRVLAVPMWLTAAALVWLLWRVTGSWADAVVIVGGLGALLMLAGRRQRRGQSATALLVLVVLLVVERTATLNVAPARMHDTGAGFSESRLATLRAAGTPVFVYFTADWCLTCKVNERVAIAPARDALRRRGVAVLVGDWTDGDPALGRFIERHGRAGVPLYLYYPKRGEARVLPQVLTPGMLAALDR